MAIVQEDLIHIQAAAQLVNGANVVLYRHPLAVSGNRRLGYCLKTPCKPDSPQPLSSLHPNLFRPLIVIVKCMQLTEKVIPLKDVMVLNTSGREPSYIYNGKTGKGRKWNVPWVYVSLLDTFQKIRFN